ncbi:EAL domain-containing protein [Wenxinia saemankumensis]|uniref:EAL domain, c-di-GMP-specific phosphodiesterase class I (Or its enzymatically inactive variant) n=1 Tax=Wenxinia saemankumensis TaxID=1447782 RepID=A0A1M6DU28_9RHOB|nr:EAL domain-containing protein [Wenxinia saemankumensis]SHI76518.1 EAL domain, c-di-GMP-specific phosphodiesterase class I (or its enzymatically inactive variant) [Wenxinia saemankumensis]
MGRIQQMQPEGGGMSPRPVRSGPAADPFSAALDSRDRDIEALVAEALSAGRLRLALQPVVGAADRRPAFQEVLVRMLDAGGRVLPAAAFLPVVGDGALGRRIDAATLGAALDLLAARPDLRLSVNMSARSIADGAWRRVLDSRVGPGSHLGERLILEMTEASAMLLPEITAGFMAEMQPRGIAFALDDFGAGPIALTHMRDFFFDLVKIDRRLAPGLTASPDDQVIVAALISIARQFDMLSVAQGIEDAGTADLFAAMGADCLQGFHIGVPRLAPSPGRGASPSQAPRR